jgi:lactate permease
MLTVKKLAPLLLGIAVFLTLNFFFHPDGKMLVFVPILVVLAAMLFFRVGGHIAGPIGLATTVVLAFQTFGLTPQILFYSQWKGFNLSLFVLMVFFPALLLYQTVNKAGGIAEITTALRTLVSDKPLLLLVTAIAFSGMLEGVAGFGLPVAIISPILVNLGMAPLQAIASVSIGHAWSVTYGDMGAIFQTLNQLVKTPTELFSPYMALLLGISILLCALAVAHLQKSLNRWVAVLAISATMIATQSFCVLNGLAAISNLVAGASGILVGALLSRFYDGEKTLRLPALNRPLKAALASYSLLALILFAVTSIPLVSLFSHSVVWKVSFPELVSANGFITPAATSTYYPLYHTGATTLLVILVTYLLNRRLRLYHNVGFSSIFVDTLKTSWQAIVGILTMVGLSTIMDHTGITVQMAAMISSWFGSFYPFISPLIGTMGAFATGSNSNSNVLFASMQENVAILLKLAPAIMIAAQTTGGSLGSMVAPAKISVGCTTTGMAGHEGDVLRITLPYGLIIGGIVGVITYAAAAL